MGTRSTIQFYNEYDQENPILCIYQQYDGHIESVGHELAIWLKGKTLINGIQNQKMEGGFANGMGCLAAQYVAAHKNGIGGFYLTTKNDEQQYNYRVRFVEGKIQIEVDNIFKGTPDELLNYKQEEE